MRIAEIIGTVTLCSVHPTLAGGRLKLAVPLTLDQLEGNAPLDNEVLVVYDELGAGIGHRIALTEGGEATQPFRPEEKPVDAYNAAILDDINLK